MPATPPGSEVVTIASAASSGGGSTRRRTTGRAARPDGKSLIARVIIVVIRDIGLELLPRLKTATNAQGNIGHHCQVRKRISRIAIDVFSGHRVCSCPNVRSLICWINAPVVIIGEVCPSLNPCSSSRVLIAVYRSWIGGDVSAIGVDVVIYHWIRDVLNGRAANSLSIFVELKPISRTVWSEVVINISWKAASATLQFVTAKPPAVL